MKVAAYAWLTLMFSGLVVIWYQYAIGEGSSLGWSIMQSLSIFAGASIVGPILRAERQEDSSS